MKTTLALFVAYAIATLFVNPYDVDVMSRLEPPSIVHLMGTDALGRDVLARVIVGTTTTLFVGISVVGIASIVGILVGCFAHRFVYDVVLSIPMFVLLIMLSLALGQGTFATIVAMLAIWWAPIARLTRSLVDIEMEKEYVTAAYALGFTKARVLLRHVLPNCSERLLAYIRLDFCTAIMTYAGLGFLGLGTIPPTPELGSMMYENREYFQQWWLVVFPGVTLLLIALTISNSGRHIER